jgi:hypothetical protein
MLFWLEPPKQQQVDHCSSFDLTTMVSKSCKARLTYLQWQERYKIERPYDIASAYHRDDIPKTNVVLVENDEEEIIHDARGHESEFELDSHGFAFRRFDDSENEFKDFYNKEAVEEVFIPEVVEPFLRKHVPGVERMFVFDWHVSCSDILGRKKLLRSKVPY